ncbi:MAG: hypothetical protein JRN24_03905, partial [Nitrososphaerota archaeon]|nr:hypothetical protein [Nitrososphaerota archaeon]
YMTERGATRLEEMKYLPCSCQVCSRTTVTDLMELDGPALTKKLATHNLSALRKELESIKEAIAEGRLWDLVEEKAGAHPKLHAAFIEFAKASKLMESGTAPMKEKGLFVRGSQDLSRPELSVAARRVRSLARRDSPTAVLLAESEELPISRLAFKEGSRPAGDFDLYRLHPELGLCPVELDFIYPFTHVVRSNYQASADLKKVRQRLKSMGYSRVIIAMLDNRGRIVAGRVRSRRKTRVRVRALRPSSPRPRSPRHP